MYYLHGKCNASASGVHGRHTQQKLNQKRNNFLHVVTVLLRWGGRVRPQSRKHPFFFPFPLEGTDDEWILGQIEKILATPDCTKLISTHAALKNELHVA